jgi:rRNA maturation endonuclease Nob1
MRTSPRSKDPRRNEGLRSLVVHRLRNAAKIIVRLPVSRNINTADSGSYNVHCEPCAYWFTLPDWGEEIKCPRCGGLFALEFAVFSAIPKETD